MKYLIFLFLLISVVGCVSEQKSDKKKKAIVIHEVAENDSVVENVSVDTITSNENLTSDYQVSKAEPQPVRKPKSNNNAINKWMVAQSPEKQYFKVASSNDTMIFGEKGTAIFIPKNSFRTDEVVEIELNEYYSPYDIFTRELSTVSGNSLLETYGMIEVIATANGEVIQPVRPLIIHFPVKNKKNSKAQLFFVNQTPSGSIDWMAQIQNFVSPTPLRLTYYYEGKKITRSSTSISKGAEDNFVAYMNTFSFTAVEMDYFKDFVARDVRIWFSFIVKDNGEFDLVQIQPKYPRKMDKRIHQFLNDFHSSEYAEPKLNPKFNQMSVTLFFTRQPSYINKVEYRQQFENKYQEFTDQNISKVSDVDLNYYVFEANRLGLINCDRFLKNKNEKIDLIVESPKNSRLMLAINGKRSYLTPQYIGGKYIFQSVPVDIEATIIGLHRKDDETLFAKQEINTSVKVVDDLQFVKVSLSQLQEEMNSLK